MYIPSVLEVYYATDTLIAFYAKSFETRKPEDFWAFCSRYRLVGELGAKAKVLIRLVEVDPKTSSAPKGEYLHSRGMMTGRLYSQAEAELENVLCSCIDGHHILPLVAAERVLTTSASNMQNYLESQNKKAQSMGWHTQQGSSTYVAIVREKWNQPDSFLQEKKTGQWSNEFKPTSILVKVLSYATSSFNGHLTIPTRR